MTHVCLWASELILGACALASRSHSWRKDLIDGNFTDQDANIASMDSVISRDGGVNLCAALTSKCQLLVLVLFQCLHRNDHELHKSSYLQRGFLFVSLVFKTLFEGHPHKGSEGHRLKTAETTEHVISGWSSLRMRSFISKRQCKDIVFEWNVLSSPSSSQLPCRCILDELWRWKLRSWTSC